MRHLPTKEALKEELLAVLSRDLESLERAYRATREAATHEEAKPENDKDTRALEQSYLARGQAQRVEELRAGLADVQGTSVRQFGAEDRAAIGALVEIEQDGTTSWMFLAPYGGGSRLASGAVQVVTPKSPLGRVLIGKRAGDAGEIIIAGKIRELNVLSVA
jgi:transcription elongation GreA/GreB family factor